MEEREMERQFMQTIRRLGRLHLSHMIGEVNRGEFAALAALERWNKRHDGKGANASMLAELVEASPQALSRTLRSLEAKAFIEWAADARDRRNVLIYLTDKGRAVLVEGKEKLRIQFGRVAAQMGEEDMRQLLYLMNRLVDVVQSVVDGQTAGGQGAPEMEACKSVENIKEKENKDA